MNLRRITNRLLCTLLLIGMCTTLSAQKVGLVMSGGAAKGIVHVGVIKALEENGIPIDYVAGTSMGAIVASFYAIGLTPEEMMDIIKSDDFHRWQTGTVDPRYRYYFRQAEGRPNIVDMSVRLRKGDSLVIRPNFLPTNVVNPQQMNFAVMELYAPAGGACRGNFDKLMVPFRCVASDIHAKQAFVWRAGDLGDAVRSSMSFPFMFRPVQTSDGRILYDGGIYNNFPVNVMREDFNPDFIVGSSVSSNPTMPDTRDLVGLVENMIVQHTDYSLEKEHGLLLEFKWDNINIWDFSAVDKLVQQGYDSTMAHMAEIKAAVNRRVTPEQITEKRRVFTAKEPALRFQNVRFKGIGRAQQNYVERMLHDNNEVFDIQQLKHSYFNLIADNVIREIVPHAIYNVETGLYDLQMDVITRDQIKVSVGGNISTSTPNQAYVGVMYQNLLEFAQSAWVDMQFGKTYNSFSLGTRLDFPNKVYVQQQFVLHRFDYYDGDRLFYEVDRTSLFKRNEIYLKCSMGFPVTMKARWELGMGYGFLRDNYAQDNKTALSLAANDRSSYSLGMFYANIKSNTHNDRMYPTAGYKWKVSAQMVAGSEKFYSAQTPQANYTNQFTMWPQVHGSYEGYTRFCKHFSLGAQADVAYSMRPLLDNYTATIIQSAQFAPTPHSRTTFNDGFCANQYLAAGIKPIYLINDMFHVRLEGYIFAPMRTILRQVDNTAEYSAWFSNVRFMSEATAVLNFKVASAGVFVNYYSYPKNDWNVGLNIGFLIFKDKYLD